MLEGTKQCNKLWSYREVRRLADLSAEEMQYFEETMARLAAAEYCEIQPVSGPVVFEWRCLVSVIFILSKAKSSALIFK